MKIRTSNKIYLFFFFVKTLSFLLVYKSLDQGNETREDVKGGGNSKK